MERWLVCCLLGRRSSLVWLCYISPGLCPSVCIPTRTVSPGCPPVLPATSHTTLVRDSPPTRHHALNTPTTNTTSTQEQGVLEGEEVVGSVVKGLTVKTELTMLTSVSRGEGSGQYWGYHGLQSTVSSQAVAEWCRSKFVKQIKLLIGRQVLFLLLHQISDWREPVKCEVIAVSVDILIF